MLEDGQAVKAAAASRDPSKAGEATKFHGKGLGPSKLCRLRPDRAIQQTL